MVPFKTERGVSHTMGTERPVLLNGESFIEKMLPTSAILVKSFLFKISLHATNVRVKMLSNFERTMEGKSSFSLAIVTVLYILSQRMHIY